MINLELYKIFVTVANEENITKASQILNISQPAITKHIKNLEYLLDIKLFERTNKGVCLTKVGEELYQKLRTPINEIMSIDNQFNKIKIINVGSHNHMLNKIFIKSINDFYLLNLNTNLNLVNKETDIMLKMLENKELDIVFSKKVDNPSYPDLKYINLGFLHDIFIVNKNSSFANKILSKNDLENVNIFVPRTYAQTVHRLLDNTKNEKLNLKNSSYSTILKMINENIGIGLITKEYIDKDDFEKYNLKEVQSELDFKPIEFGIYLNNSSFHELNILVKIIKDNF